MVKLGDHVLISMGFDENPTKIHARFAAYQIFDVRGIEKSDHSISANLRSLAPDPPVCFFDASVNRAFRFAFNIDLAEDEEAWRKENSAYGPILLIGLKARNFHVAEQVRWMEDNEIITTYQAFADAKKEARDALELILPQIRHRLAASFKHFSPSVSIIPVASGCIGHTDKEKPLRDWSGISFSASAFVSASHPAEAVREALEFSEKGLVSPISACLKAFYYACDEREVYKKFLFYFLALEIAIASVDLAGGAVPSQADCERLPKVCDWLNRYEGKKSSLKYRFAVWSLLHLNHLSEDDILCFQAMVDIRNDIAHGRRFAVASNELALLSGLAEKVIFSF